MSWFMNITWLIWATYSPFPKISENKMENRSESTWPRVFHLILYRVFRYFRKWKARGCSGSSKMIL